MRKKRFITLKPGFAPCILDAEADLLSKNMEICDTSPGCLHPVPVRSAMQCLQRVPELHQNIQKDIQGGIPGI